jgi:hypothetical protein
MYMQRPLGTTEHNYWLLNQVAPLNVVVSARVQGQVGAARLREALDQVQRLHPLLGVRLVGGTAPMLTSRDVPPLPLRLATGAGLAELERELDTPFPQQGPLARVVLQEAAGEAEILCCYSHLIGDGLAGVYLLRDILRQLAHPGTPEPWPERPPFDAMLPPAEFDVGLPQPPDLGLLAGVARGLLRGEDASAQRTRLQQRTIGPQITRRLAERCRAQQTTVHGALCAALLLAAADETPGTAAQTLACGSAVNVRQRLTVPLGEEFGLYAAALLIRHRIDPTSTFWQVARDATAQLRADLQSDRRLFAFMRDGGRLLDLVTNPVHARRLLWISSGCASLVLGVSNLGRLDLPRHFGDLELLGLHFASTPQLPVQVAVAATTVHDLLTCILIYSEPHTSAALAERLGERMIGYLAAAA